MTDTHRSTTRLARLASLAVVVLTVACGSSSSPPAPTPPAPPTLQSVTIGTGKLYASVGTPRQFTLTGHYSDGSTAALTSGITWASSDPAVATADAGSGIVTPWAKGRAQITARHDASGLSASADLTSRLIVPVSTGGRAAGDVDLSWSYFHITGLTPGAMYTPTVSHMSDDVDIAVYADDSMEAGSELCFSESIGTGPESCIAPANASGDLWLAVDGEWTLAGAKFEVEVPGSQPLPLAATLTYPSGFPYSGTIGVGEQMFKAVGLTPGAQYEVRIANLSADIDLDVHADAYDYLLLCESFKSGTVDDFCTATANSAGEFYIETDGATTRSGGTYTLTVTPK